MEENEEPIDVRALAKKRYEVYLQQKRAHEELEKLGLTEGQQEQQQMNAGEQQSGNTNNNRQKILSELTRKIAERFEQSLMAGEKKPQQSSQNPQVKKQNQQLEQMISKEIENCTCPICYELMVPPLNSPVLIFPCGHTFCKQCLLPKNSQITKCPFCRKPFTSHALNLHLQNIICAYTDNKHLIQQNQDQEELNAANNRSGNSKNSQGKQSNNNSQINDMDDNDYEKNYQLYSLRCKILEQEKSEVIDSLAKAKEVVHTQEVVVKQLQQQKKNVTGQLEKLQKELKLINDFIEENRQQLEVAEQKQQAEQEKLQLLEQTILPLKHEKDKYALLAQNQSVPSSFSKRK